MAEVDDIKKIFGGVWKTPDVTEQPIINLERWRAFEILEGPLQGERHLVGYNMDDREGRVSTAIISFDLTKRVCLTASGRIYHLVGPSGYDPDGDFVWQLWARAHRISARDVSSLFESVN